MTIGEVKERFKQAREIRAEIEQLKEEKQKMWYELINITGSFKERVQASSVGRNNERILKYLEYDELITQKVYELIELKTTIEINIEKLPQSKYRKLLRYYYIDCLTWEQIAETMNVDVRTVYRMHGRALLSIAEEAE